MNKVINRTTSNIMPLLLFVVLLCFSVAPASAQEGGPHAPGEAEQNMGNQGGDLGRLLGLTPEQVAKIRMIRQQHQEERRLAGERLGRAHRALDEAIYSDDVSEAVIEERAREVAAAQTAVVRLRALTELSIRRVLTPDQLTTLRTLRLRQARQRLLRRELNQPRAGRDRQPRNPGGGPPLPPERFRQRDNAPLQPNDSNRPIAAPRVRRNETFRRAQP